MSPNSIRDDQAIFVTLASKIEQALADGELRRLCPGLFLMATIKCDADAIFLHVENGEPRIGRHSSPRLPTVEISANGEAWSQVLKSPPPPTFHSFTAFALANPEFTINGDPLVVAQSRAFLERLFECVVSVGTTAAVFSPSRDMSQIRGAYHRVNCESQIYEIYAETAGRGTPVMFFHTAGADSRQFHGQLSDQNLAKDCKMIAADLPFHGRSMPPPTWTGTPYRLTTDQYLSWCVAIIEQVVGEPVVAAGGSMGAAISMVLAAKRPDLLKGVVAIEPPFRSKGRLNRYQNDVAVHAGLHNSSFVRGLMSPTSPEVDRRSAAWIYSQGAPGIYAGDLSFYSTEFDGEVVAPHIDAVRTPISLLCGTYDYSATPEDGKKLAALISGARYVVMDGLGHFPMCENPDLFRGFLIDALAHAGVPMSTKIST